MPIVRNKQKIRVQTFNGGEDSTSEPSVVQSPFASIARNTLLDALGKATARDGIVLTGDSPDTLISHYNFDASSSVDSVGSNDGVDESITYVDGKFGKAASFNGTTSIITVSADTTIDIVDMGAFVITVWLRPNTDGENDTGRIFTKGSSYAGILNESSDVVDIDFVVDYDSTDARVITSTTIASDQETFTKIELHHNADKSLDVYINGVKASYATDTQGVGSLVDDGSDDLIIGNNTGTTLTFDGVIDDFRIYDGTRAAIQYEMDKIFGLTRYTTSSIDRIYRIRDVNLERLDDDLKGWTGIDAGFTADKDTNFVQAKDLLFILNKTENVHSMNDSESITDEGNFVDDGASDPPKTVSFGAWAQNNRLFLSGSAISGQEDWVWFSDSLDPQSYAVANVFKVRSGSGGATTWLEPFKLNELIIYKEDSIFVLNMTGATPLTDWTLQPLNTTVGCKAGRTVQDVGNDQIFLDDQGFVRFLSRTSFDKIKTSIVSSPIQSTLNNINLDAIEKCSSEFIDGKYYLAYPSGTATENDAMVIWDSEAAALTGNPASGWTVVPQGKIYASYFSNFLFGDNTIRLVSGDSRTVSLVYKHAGNNDNGEAISMEVAGPLHDLGNRSTDKIWGPLHVVFDSGEATTVELFANIDQKGFESIATLSLEGDAPTLPLVLPFNLGGSVKTTGLFTIKQVGRGKTCIILAIHNTYNQKATFIEYELMVEERIPRP